MSPDRSSRRRWFTGRGAFDDLAQAVSVSPRVNEWSVTVALIAAPLVTLVARGPGATLAVIGGIGAAGLAQAGTWSRLISLLWIWATAVVFSLGFVYGDPIVTLAPLAAAAVAWIAFGVTRARPIAHGAGSMLVLAVCAMGLSATETRPYRLYAYARRAEPLLDLLLGIGLIGLARIGTRVPVWATCLVAAAFAAVAGEFRVRHLDQFRYVGWIPTAVASAMTVAFFARVARSLAEAPLQPGAVDRATRRLMVRLHHHPWRSSWALVGAEAVFLLATVWAGETIGSDRRPEAKRILGAAFAGAFFTLWCTAPAVLLHLTRGARWSLERLAPVVVSLLGLTALGLGFLLLEGGLARVGLYVPLVVAIPVIWALITERLYPRRGAPAIAWALLLVVAAVPWVTGEYEHLLFAGVAVAPIVVHQLAVVERPLWSFLSFVALAVLTTTRFETRLGMGAVVGGAVVLAFGAVACRRARTMTAVPLDHPIYVDFGGPVGA